MFKKKLTQEQLNVSAIFERLCAVYQVKNNANLEKLLDLSSAYCTTRIKRASIPYDLIDQAARTTGASYDHILYGTPIKNISLSDLDIIENGLLKGLLGLQAGGFIESSHSFTDLKSMAQLPLKAIETELSLYLSEEKKDSA
ncbi:helix-turn-helix domain-containing protein [Pseudoalteromonas sp. 68 DY56-GL68]|uniref:helix-turn-helix domain-containing protein n=1 Tax=Pseudoalteromonas sp. 68 DY56-GL68 TaxID=2974919 RepID=UPI00352B8D37